MKWWHRSGPDTNGESQPPQRCRYDAQHVFDSLDGKLSHEPSCPNNPDRVDESDNPERW